MKLRHVSSCLAALLLLPAVARAQASESDFAAWTGIMLTPIGSVPMIELAPSTYAARSSTVALRLASWKFSGPGNDRNTTFGGSFFKPVGTKAMMGFTGAYYAPGGSSGDGTLMLGADVGAPIWQSVETRDNPLSLTVRGRGSVGYGRYMGAGGGNTYSLVASVPVIVQYAMTNKSSLSFFVTPGFGFAGVSGDPNADSGTRPMMSFGGAWTTPTGVGIHFGTQKVMMDGDLPWVPGLSVSIPTSRK